MTFGCHILAHKVIINSQITIKLRILDLGNIKTIINVYMIIGKMEQILKEVCLLSVRQIKAVLKIYTIARDDSPLKYFDHSY